MKSRLSTVAPDLDDTINISSDLRRNSISLALAEWALSQVHFKGEVPQSVSDAGVILDALEENYYELQKMEESGRATQQEVLSIFVKARAINALLLHFKGETAEAAYEAIIATDDVVGACEIANKIKA